MNTAPAAQSPESIAPSNATPIHPLLRAWIGLEVFFGIAASTATFIDPARAAEPGGFAWPIPVTVMAAVLGVFYAASVPVTLWAMSMRTWQELRTLAAVLVPFATAMTMMTFLHWDKFNHGSLAFNLWLLSYVGPPIVVGGFYRWQQRQAAPVGTGITHPFRPGVRAFLRLNGTLLLILALFIWLRPAALVAHAPFTLTPLTARTLANFVLVAGVTQYWMALEGDWRRTRVGMLFLVLIAVLLFLQLGRFVADVDMSSPFLLFLLADLTLTSVLFFQTWVRGERVGAISA